MAKTIKPLTATQVEAAKPKDKDYNLFDGDGLYLRIRPTGTKTWVFRYKTSLDKIHKMTIGNYPEIKLAFARDKRTEYRRYLAEGVDLKELLGLGEKGKEDNSLECISRAWLTKYAVRKPLEEHTKHKRLRKLENHLFPKIGHIPITDIRPRDLRIVLNTIFEKSADNAQRIRSDLILIFSYAVQYGHIEVNHAREMESLDLNAPKRHSLH